ncbi:MAG: glycine zipper 2TM domain-containing protein [Sphingomonas sp.]|nr:glycine zipper 2TM domain-containing protein [Sphingomonas sp.]
MRTLFLALSGLSVALSGAVTVTAPAAAHERHRDYRDDDGHYRHDNGRRHRQYAYREWRGRDGRTYCRKSDGTTGLVLGAVGGALIGRTIDTRGDRLVGTLGGAAVGALAGQAIDRSSTADRRCR